MPRGPRFIFKNAFYHVFNRGINKQQIFFTEQDYNFFLGKLYDLKRKYDHSIYAYCLMPNHFHLSIQTRRNTISKIMSSLTTSYAMYFNRIYTHFGSVFQNRFKSILIDGDLYFNQLSKYIYLNPVKAGIVKNPLDYKYSSISEALGIKPLSFLDEDIVRLVGETKGSREQYQQFIFQGLNENLSEIEKLFERDQSIFGTNKFHTFAEKKYLRIRRVKKTA